MQVIDLISLKPFDLETITKSIKKTRKCIIVEECMKTGGIGASLSAVINESLFNELDHEVAINPLTPPSTPKPLTPSISSSIINLDALAQVVLGSLCILGPVLVLYLALATLSAPEPSSAWSMSKNCKAHLLHLELHCFFGCILPPLGIDLLSLLSQVLHHGGTP